MSLKSCFKNTIKTISFLTLIFLNLAEVSCTTCKAIVYRHRVQSTLHSAITEDHQGNPRVIKENRYAVVHLYGNAVERSAQYGKLLREPLLNINKLLMSFLPANTVNKYVNYAWHLHKVIPDSIKMELKAMSDASGVPYWNLASLNLIPRFLCSGIAAWGSATKYGSMIIGRNAEYPAFGLEDRGSIICVHHINKNKHIITFSVIGMIGAFTGYSSDGIFFSNMLVENAKEDTINFDGMAIQLQLRTAAEKAQTLDEMVQIITEYTPAIAMNLLLADSSRALIIERSLNDFKIVSADTLTALFVTNHFRSPSLAAFDIDCSRYNALRKDVFTNKGEITVSHIQHFLYNASIHRINIQAIIVEPARNKIYVSMNKVPASKGPFIEIEANKLFFE